jgi:DNA-binding NarL/FixJ family response regulator
MRILIAEDNEPVRLVLRRTIEAHDGWTVCGEAADGVQAVEQAQRFKPDLIVLDYAMPQANGLQAAHRISEMLPGVPILLNTLYDYEIVHAEAIKHGVSCVIPKSDVRVLIAAIKGFAESISASKIVPPVVILKTEPSNSPNDPQETAVGKPEPIVEV